MSNTRLDKLKEMLLEDPADLFVKYATAMEYLGLQEIVQAEFIFREVIAADETYVAAYYQLGKILEQTGKETEAVSVFERGLIHARNKKDTRTINEFMTAIEELTF